MMFPSPQSARLLVRRTHATCVDEVSRLYVEVIGAWLAEERIERSGNPDNEDEPFSETAQNIFKAQLLALMVKLRGIRTYISQAGFEVSLRGDWPAEEYGALLTSQLATLEALAQLGVALVRLDGRWRRKLVTTTAFLNSNLVSLIILLQRSVYPSLNCCYEDIGRYLDFRARFDGSSIRITST